MCLGIECILAGHHDIVFAAMVQIRIWEGKIGLERKWVVEPVLDCDGWKRPVSWRGSTTPCLQPWRVARSLIRFHTRKSETSNFAHSNLLVFVIKGNDEFQRFWLNPWISVFWRAKLLSLQPCRMYMVFENTDESEPHVMNWQNSF